MSVNFKKENVVMSDFIVENGELKNYTGSSEDVVVPEDVKIIGEDVFFRCKMKSIRLPSGLKKIKDGAFRACNQLEEIDIPDNVTSIGRNAFCGSALARIKLPAKLTRIREGSFQSTHCLLYTSRGGRRS